MDIMNNNEDDYVMIEDDVMDTYVWVKDSEATNLMEYVNSVIQEHLEQDSRKSDVYKISHFQKNRRF